MRLPLPPWARRRRGRPRAKRRRPRAVAAVLAVVVLLTLWWANGGERTHWPRAAILDALRLVESGGRDDVPDGDDGAAIGPYQIHEVYWRDAMRAAPALGGTYQDCRRREYAERVIDAYMRKWAADAWRAGRAETIARVHNGGPEGASKTSTDRYWRRVRAQLP